MRKHRYKASPIESVNWDKIATQVAGQQIVLGVDVAKEDFFAVLMKADRSVIETIKWVHPEQTRELGERLLDAQGKGDRFIFGENKKNQWGQSESAD